DGSVKPGGGTLTAFDPPSGTGVRVDSFGYAGYTTSPRYDSLLAKVIVHSAGDFSAALNKTWRALCECRIDGVPTNLPLLKNLLRHDAVAGNRIHTRFIDQHLAELLTEQDHPQRTPRLHTQSAAPAEMELTVDENSVRSPMQGTLVAIVVENDAHVRKGQTLVILDAMKMEHVITAPHAGTVQQCQLKKGDAVREGQVLLQLLPREVEDAELVATENLDPDRIRPDLAEVRQRHAYGLDENRPDAVAKRRATGQRTARENIADLCDADTFVEYGSLAIAAQRRRRQLQDLIEKTPGDGMVCGIGRVNGEQFGDAGRCVLMTYDYTVMAGTQGIQNHRKKDRMFELAQQWRLPVVLFSEGGGGRPGDTDGLGSSASLDCLAFILFAKLSGLVPLVGIASGRNFAGNAALLGCCDVVIATRNANIGMGGPAMIEGGGLGVYAPEQVGPISVQVPNGVIDILVDDEANAVRAAKQYLSYFQGDLVQWQAPDQRLLRTLVPENRLRAYDVRAVINGLADVDSVLELRPQFGLGMITAFARIEGRPVGIIANNPQYLAGAIDTPGADKAARFMQLCDGFDIPILFLCDTPGIMVGPEVEKTALVRHVSRMFVTAASLTVPFFTIVLRKAYGLGAMTMAGGTLKAPLFTVSWPTGEFGAMGLEGAVKLGFRKELEAVQDPEQRDELFRTMVADMYERGKAVNNATFFEFDDVIDPADSRHWIMTALRSAPKPAPRNGKKRPCIDTW
ncbi:MAG TPA: carboxyl transferase domain-containing protein, partial [Dongiaceae bacterium]|nr:carboxyl transferase domain-containing protein [Dongiaceae bacterium]